jgi:hypothetical protein
MRDAFRIAPLKRSLRLLRSARAMDDNGTGWGSPDVGIMMALHEYVLAMKMMMGP